MSSGKKPRKGAPVEIPRRTRIRWSVRAKTSRWKQSQPAGQRAFASENYLTSAGCSETRNERLQTWWKLNIYYCKQFWTEIFEVQRWVTFSLFSSNMCHPEMICFDLIQCRRKWSMTNFLTKADNIVSGICSFFLDNKSFTERKKSRLNMM